MRGGLRAASLLGSAAVLVWTGWDPRLRDASGFLGAPAALTLAIAVALLVVGATGGGQLSRAGRWGALAVLGWAAHLQLVEAGPRVSYHHLVLPDLPTSRAASVAVAILAAQVLAVLTAAPALLRRLVGVGVSPVRVGGGALALLAVAAVPSAEPGVYVAESVASLLLQVLHLATVALTVAALPPHALTRFDAWLSRPTARGTPLEVWAAAAGTTVVSATLCLLVYQNHPHVPDEFVYLMPARYFAEGLLALPAPPVADAFDIDLMVNDGTRWYSPVPPGWPAVLALGSLIGAPWLVNPVLGGACVLLTWRLVSVLYDARTARLATLLLAASPWLLFLSMSFMTHVLPLFLALVAAVSVDECRRRSVAWPALIGGGAIGWIGLTRPLEAVATAGAVGIWCLWIDMRNRRLLPTLALAAGAIAVGSLTFPYNEHFTGSPTQFPLMVYTDVHYGEGTNALGFGANRGLGWPGLDPFPGHGAIDVVVNAALNFATINTELFGWGTGSLLLVVLLFLGRGVTRTDLAVGGAAAFVVFLHSFYWFNGGPDYAGRYWFLVIVPMAILSARGALATAERLPSAERGRVSAGVLTLSAIAVAVFLPWRSLDKYHDYRGMEPGARELSRDRGFGRSLVLVRGERHPDYASAAYYNPLDWFADEPIYAWDRSPEVTREVLARYPDRPVWIVDGPTVSGNGFQVVEGPLSPDAAAARYGR